jgi:hypothetical protein
VAYKSFDLAGRDECSPKGSTRLVADRLRFTHEPIVIVAIHGVTAVGAAKFISEKPANGLAQCLKSSPTWINVMSDT